MSRKQKEPNLETASREELVDYVRRLKLSRDQMQTNNKALSAWMGRLNSGIALLSSEGSLAFQAMAERAGVRGHPSVTAVVQLFDSLVGLQWGRDDVPKIIFPDEWNFDGPVDSDWSGDADMQLNAPIADLIDIIESCRFGAKLPEGLWKALTEAVGRVQQAMRTHIEGIKSNHGFIAKTVNVKDAPHGLGWALLDLAQDMHFANHMLRRDLRAAVYRRVCSDLYALSHAEDAEGPSNFDIKVLGGESQPF